MYSTKPIEITIPEHCPWHNAQVQYGTPNVDWCEPTICSYINEPANTWSNLGYLLIGLWLWKKMEKYQFVRGFGLIVFLMGFCSFIYHATNNLPTQYLDFYGIALMTSYLAASVYRRIKHLNGTPFDIYFWLFLSVNLTLVMLLTVFKIPLQLMMLINFIPIFSAELYYSLIQKKVKTNRYLFLSFVLLAIAQTCAILDIKRIYCEPTNIFLHGHVLWHCFGALAMLAIGWHLKHAENRISNQR